MVIWGVGFMGFASYGSNFFLELLALKHDLPVVWGRDKFFVS